MEELFYGSKGLSVTEMNYGAPKVEKIVVVTFVEKYSADWVALPLSCEWKTEAYRV